MRIPVPVDRAALRPRSPFPALMLLGVLTVAIGGGPDGGAVIGEAAAATDAAPPTAASAPAVAAEELDAEAVLAAAPPAHREAAAFLLRHMPERDRRTLDEAFLLEHVAGRIAARDASPWAGSLPEELFLNDVLPYAVLSESRERLDPAFIERARAIVNEAEATTPGEAALALNRRLFGELGVRYGTDRRRPDQSVAETCEQGVASCSGLSILLVQACRAVAVPARVAGVAAWADDRGNHTWVEVWDGERWRFVGAAEPDARGFDHAWFTGDAARAVPGHPRHAVIASSWAETGRSFPMVWAPGDRSVPGVDVTRRYLAGDAAGDPSAVRLMVRVVGPDDRRLVAEVAVNAAGGEPVLVRTHGPQADRHRHAEAAVPPGGVVRLTGRTEDGRVVAADVDLASAEAGETRLVTLRATASTAGPGTEDGDAAPVGPGPGEPTAGEAGDRPLTTTERDAARAWFDAFFAADAGRQAALAAIDHPLDGRLRTVAGDAALRAIAADAWRAGPVRAATAADVAADRVRAGGRESPYTIREVGERPTDGWGLVIAMHGGGGVPKRVNDQQWSVMQRYYRDQPAAGGYLYVALRAPTDEWNGFYTGYVYPLIEQLIAQLLVHRDVDPQRVHVIGYSHGGYGAYAIGPNLPDRFATAHASAAAGTPGETVIESLINLRFTAMIGEKDTAYGRIERNREFRARLERLRAEHGPGSFPGGVTEIAGNGHGGLPDRDILATMLPHRRIALPPVVWWHQTGAPVRAQYWLGDSSPRSGRLVMVRRDGNSFDVTARAADAIELRLDARLVDLGASVRVRTSAGERSFEVRPRIGTLAETLRERRDPTLASTVVLEVPLPAAE